jgi:H+/Cl- antiporter ClcA
MSKDTLVLIAIMFAIAVISGLLTAWRTASFATAEDVASKELSTIRRDRVLFYGVFMPVAVGLISFFVYRWMHNRSPDSAQTTFLLLAVGIAIGFTILAAVVFKMRGFAEFVVLHVVYAGGFGWMMPLLLNK